MKKMNRFIAVLLALALTAMFAGCGGSSAASSATASAAGSETASAAAEPETAEAEPAEAEPAEAAPASAAEAETAEAEPASAAEETASGYDTYTGCAPASESAVTYPIEEQDVTLSFWTPFTSNMPDIYEDITDIPCVEKISENVGVTIDWTTVSGMEMFTQFNLMAASGDYCDMIEAAVECYSGGAISALDDGIITDLTDYIEQDAPDYLAAMEARGAEKDILTSDGRYACIWGCYNKAEDSHGYVIRQDWLDELGLEVPVTYEDYFNVLSAFVSEYNCTNAFLMCETCQDELSTPAGYGTPGYKLSAFGSGSDLYQEDGTVKSSFTQDGYRDYLAEMNRWYKAGLFTSDFPTISSRANDADRSALINSGNVGIFGTGASNISIFSESMGGVTLTGIGNPVVNEGDITHFSAAMTINSQCDVAISSSCENIDAALKYLNYYFTDDGVRMYNYGIEGETYNLVDGKIEYTDVIMNPADGYTPFTMTEAYVLVGGIASITYADRQLDFATDESSKAAWDTWNSCQDLQNVLPEGLSLTTEESAEVSSLQSDLYTYTQESIPRFILGELNTDSDWDEFVETVKSLGIDDILSIYQDALDRYYAM